MSQEKELLARGAETVTGDLILKGKIVGRYRHGEFQITEDGLLELEVIEIVAFTAPAPALEEPKAPKARAPRARKAEVAEEPVPEPAPQEPDELADILGGE